MNDGMACSSQRILIVEDDNDLRAMLESNLGGLSLQTKVVIDGVEALRTILEGIKDLQSYPIVILDCAMPFVDGFTVVRTIRCLESHKVLPFRTRIGMYTGYSELLEPSTLVQESDIDGFVLKGSDSEDAVEDMVKGFVEELGLRRE